MSKKEKYLFKYVRPEQLAEYKLLSLGQMISTLQIKNSELQQSMKFKKGNDYLKELAKEIAEFRKDNTSEELASLEGEIKVLKEARDEDISDAIDEHKDILGGLNDAIKAGKEHVDVLLGLLPSSK